MYVDKGSGLEVYESFEELISKGVVSAWDYHGKYYVVVESEDYYDNRIWIVDKKTKEISDDYYTKFIQFMNKATPVDPKTLKRVS